MKCLVSVELFKICCIALFQNEKCVFLCFLFTGVACMSVFNTKQDVVQSGYYYRIITAL